MYYSSYKLLVFLKTPLLYFCGCKLYVIIDIKVVSYDFNIWLTRLARLLIQFKNPTNLIIETCLCIYTYSYMDIHICIYTQICYKRQGSTMVLITLTLLRCFVHGYISHETMFSKTPFSYRVMHLLYVVLGLVKTQRLMPHLRGR